MRKGQGEQIGIMLCLVVKKIPKKEIKSGNLRRTGLAWVELRLVAWVPHHIHS